MNDVIRGKIIHVAKMATKDEISVDVDFAVCLYKKECFYFISRGIFSLFIQCLYGYVIVTLKLSCKDIPGSMKTRAENAPKKCELKFWLNRRGLRQQTRAELLPR